jgi:hypothetical protein
MSGSNVSVANAPQSARPGHPLAGHGGVVVRKGPRGRPGKCLPPVSRDAQRVAAAVLEVLAGVRTPTEAAVALSLSVPRYYLWEQRALEGLVRACEPRLVGKAAHERHQITVLEKEVIRLRQDCARQQALVRASQRTIGLAALPSPATRPEVKPGGKATAGTAQRSAGGAVAGKAKRKRRPIVRALKAVAALQASPAASESLADSSSAIAAIAADVVQRSVPSSSSATAEAAPAADHASMVPAVLET